MIDVARPEAPVVTGTADRGRRATLRDRAAALVRRDPVTVRFDRREALTAVAVHLAVSAVGFTVLLVLARHLGFPAWHVLRRWDSENYLAIAGHGYPGRLSYLPDGLPRYSTLAFFPLYPALVWLVAHATGLPLMLAALTVTWLGGCAAAAGVHTLAGSLAGRRAGYACVGLWACTPYAFALWVPYSEACFAATLTWALVALVAGRWVAAGALTALAGAIGPTASVMVGVLVVSAGWSLLRGRDGRRPWAGMLLAPTGLLFSWLFLGARAGRLDGWFQAERAWGQTFDFGHGTACFLKTVVLYRRHPDIRYAAVIMVILLVAVGVLALTLDRVTPWPLVLALAGAWTLSVGTPGSPLSKPRFLLPFMPILLLLLARPVSRLPRLVQGCLYTSGAVFAGWYAVGLLLLFRWSP